MTNATFAIRTSAQLKAFLEAEFAGLRVAVGRDYSYYTCTVSECS